MGTSDAEGAKKFYSGLFGWDLIDMPAGDAGIYVMAQLRGKPVAALYQMGQEQLSQGMPPFWNSYITVANAAGTAEKAKSLGGTVLMEPMDVMGAGLMAMVQDSEGATFAVWEPKEHIGAEIVNEPNTFTWNELAARNTEAAAGFYTQLFGWGTHVQDMGNGNLYTTFMNGERMNAGMMAITKEMGDVPPHWLVDFAIADVDAGTKQVKALGGNVIMPPTDIEQVGRFAVVQDPQGAMFSIIKLLNPQ